VAQDDFLGRVSINLEDVARSMYRCTTPRWEKVYQAGSDSSAGEVLVSCQMFPMEVTHPFNTSGLPLSYSGDPGVNVSDREGRVVGCAPLEHGEAEPAAPAGTPQICTAFHTEKKILTFAPCIAGALRAGEHRAGEAQAQ
jgi:hypothetical protein